MTHGCSKSTFGRPAIPQPLAKGTALHVQFGTPHRNTLRLAVKGQESVVSLVTALFCRCSPTAIGLEIALTVVNTVNRVLWAGTVSHVCKESGKRLPALAHSNATSPIQVIFPVVGVGATMEHAGPYSVFGRLVHAVFVAMVTFGRIVCSHDRTPVTRLVRAAGRYPPSGCSSLYTKLAL